MTSVGGHLRNERKKQRKFDNTGGAHGEEMYHLVDHGYFEQATSVANVDGTIPQVEAVDNVVDPSSTELRHKKSKSNRLCCVPECHTTGYNEIPGHGKPSFHRFPPAGDPNRRIWLNKIRRDEGSHFKITQHTVVCSLHFEEDALEKFGFSGRTYLKPGAVPTKFECWKNKVHLFKQTKPRQKNVLQQRREENIKNCQIDFEIDAGSDESTATEETSNIDLNISSAETQVEYEILNNSFLLEHVEYLQNKTDSVSKENEKLKYEIEKLKAENDLNNFSIENLKPSEVQFYTGFSSKDVFDTVLDLVNPGEKGENIVMYAQKDSGSSEFRIKKPRKLSPANQFLLFLCRVRVGLFECDLARRFNVSIGTVSMLVITWANFLYLRLGSMNIWPSRVQVDKTMPVTFREKYPTTRVIIDCTEVKTEMASSLLLKSQTYSNYKSSNTLKGLVGIAPCGNLSFVSQLYLGNISDREITQRSGFLDLNFNHGDSVMADKGFDIQDLLDKKGVKLNCPPFLGQYGQMTEFEVKKTQSIAAERIHVERAINKIKNFHIFDQAIPMSLFGSINQIWTVCAMLTLFQDPIISCPGN